MKRIVALVLGVAMMVPSVAFAQGGSTCQTYNPQTCSVTSNGKQTATPASASTLPFTGINVGLLVAGGGALLGVGLVVRRVSRAIE